MLVLLAAATVAAAPLPKTEPMPNFYSQPARCGPLHEGVTRRIQATHAAARPLFQYAVERQVAGCGLPAPAGYRQDYLLPGRADAPQYRPTSDGAATKR